MGLVDVVLMGLCFNITCPGDSEFHTGLSQTRKNRFSELAAELKNEHFIIATTENKPMSYTETINNTLVLRGTAFDFIDIIREKYGFTYEVVVPTEKNLDKDGNGILAMISNGRADIAATFLPVMPAFRDYIDYSRDIDEGEWVVLMKRPQESATGSGLFAPFTLEVWFLILFSLMVVGPIIYSLIVLQHKLCIDDDPPIFPLPSCVWFVYGALLKQGSTLSPLTDSSRLLFATWWIFITILTAFYTANLTAFLTLSKFTLPVTEPKDIGAKKYSWVTQKGSAIEQSINWVPDFKKYFDGSKSEYVEDPGDKILSDWVAKKDYMYIGEKPIVEHLMYNDYMYRADAKNISEADRCTFVITKWNVLTIARAFAFSKNFKYNDLFDDIIAHLVESGIVKYKFRDGLPNTAICPLDLGGNERQLRNSDLLMTYVLIGGGFGVAGLIFCIEVAVQYCKKQDIKTKAPNIHNFYNNNQESKMFKKRRKMGEFKFNNFVDNNNVKGTLWHEMSDEDRTQFPPPPPYHALFHPPFANSPNGKKKQINGREYWEVKSVYGESKLIPVRTPSALLFQYTQ